MADDGGDDDSRGLLQDGSDIGSGTDAISMDHFDEEDEEEDADEDDEDEDMDSASEIEMSQPSGEEGATAWNCSRCTYENARSSSICEICGAPKATTVGSAASTEGADGGNWACSACTLLNPREAHVCSVCTTPNPAHLNSHRGLNLASALGLFADKPGGDVPQLGISGEKLEALCAPGASKTALVDALQSITHHLAMMDASADTETGFNVSLFLGRPKNNRLKHDSKMTTMLCSILKQEAPFSLECRLLACQSINYLVKLDDRTADGKRAVDRLHMYLQVMAEMAAGGDGDAKLRQQVAEEALNGLEAVCTLQPLAFRALSEPEHMLAFLAFLAFAETLHLQVLLTALTMLYNVCSKAKMLDRKNGKQKQTGSPGLGLTHMEAIVAAIVNALRHPSARVQVAAIKCLTTLYLRASALHRGFHRAISTACMRQLLGIMVQAPQDDSHEASRAAVALLTKLLDDAPALLATIVSAAVASDLLTQLTVVLKTSKSEAVITSTLRFLARVVKLVHSTAPSPLLQDACVACVRADAVAAVSTLLRDGASLHEGPDMLLEAVQHGSIEMIRFLVQKGADISAAALHEVALRRRCDVLSYFIQHGANPATLNAAGQTVAQAVAAAGGENACAKLLAMYESQRDEASSDDRHSSGSSHHEFAREWMIDDGMEESEASEHEYDDEDDDDDMHDDADDDVSNDDASMDSDRDRALSIDSTSSEPAPPLPDTDVAAFTSTLLGTLLDLCPTVDNKAIAQTILATVSTILATTVDLTFAQTAGLLEIVQGLLIELQQAPDDAAAVGPFVLALRLLHAMTRSRRADYVVQMERQGILAQMEAVASRQAPSLEATLGGLARAWLDDLASWYEAPATSLDVAATLASACARGDVAEILTLLGGAHGVTTYEFTKSNVVPTLLARLGPVAPAWQPSMAALVHHLHMAIGLHEALPVVSYGMAKGKELYPLTRQLRCRLRLVPKAAAVATMPPRSIHASPLTLYASFERTVFRCATLTDTKWTAYAWNLVGHLIWRQVDGKWIENRVVGFDPASGAHLLCLRDEYSEEVLHEEPYRLVKTPLTVYSDVRMALEAFGVDPTLKRKAEDTEASCRPKRARKRAMRLRAASEGKEADDEMDGDDDGETADVDMEANAPPRGKRKRLLDLLKLDQATTSAVGDLVWLRSPLSDICVSAVVVKRLEGNLLSVHASFGTNPVPVLLTVDESSLVAYQPKARPGTSSSSKGTLPAFLSRLTSAAVVNRMIGALESQFRQQGGRPMLEQLRRLLGRSRGDEASAAATAPLPPAAAKAKGKQKSLAKPEIMRSGESWTCGAPPTVRCLLGYGEYSDKGFDEGLPSHPLQAMVLTMNQKDLLDSARPIFAWLFDEFASERRPTALPPTFSGTSLQQLSLAAFGTFLEALNLGMLASEEWIWFAQYAAVEHDRACMVLSGFYRLVAHICRDTRRCKLLWKYLEGLGATEATFATPTTAAPTQLMSFAADENLLMCLGRLKPLATNAAHVAPWKCIYSLYCDFQVTWDDVLTTDGSGGTLALPPTSYRDVVSPVSPPVPSLSLGSEIDQALALLAALHQAYGTDANTELWVNTRLSRKLRHQLQDVLSITSGAYPPWCDELTREFKFLFPLELRHMLFRTTAFGCSRSLHWFRDHLEGSDAPSADASEVLSVSPLPKERAKVERADILKSAEAVMKVHAKRKAILDIVFVGERGYGSGVTAAFYSAAAAALQVNAPFVAWVRGHEESTEDAIRHPNGLFPMPTVGAKAELVERFRLVGRLAGKALLDDRLLPLPLSPHFIQLVLGQRLVVTDLPTIFLEPGRTMLALYKAAEALKTTPAAAVTMENTPIAAWLEAVDLSFVDPCTQAELVDDGEAVSVTVDNLGAYVDAVLDQWLVHGIQSQVTAFREGLADVVPMAKLQLLEVGEIQATLCGTVDVEWTEEALRQTIKIAHGYTAASAPVAYFIQTLVAMSTTQRRAFLLYATGCPNLPPGGVGLEKLKPTFEVVRRVIDDTDDVDRALPFARTCTNTLHLPAYSSQSILAAQLEYAVLNSKGVIDRD
ncbi:HECT E3 ubiquitin ligase [Achlya hypogyna]|uniref:HECT E3 ubiquitin ligase n=1 Tax=Achlya hypogyna TaxID=1202772 RepID=A0A1V9YM15_ACHHY|nr:HECT E3 ubiquitin ligase [Achlya hypogyna]